MSTGQLPTRLPSAEVTPVRGKARQGKGCVGLAPGDVPFPIPSQAVMSGDVNPIGG